MEAISKKYKSVNEYHADFPGEVQEMMEQLRTAIKQAAPKAEEMISYNMPAYKLNGVLVYYAAYKNHIGFYPMPSALKKFKNELGKYKTSKGGIQFPLDESIPKTLVKNIVKFRVKENLDKAESKTKAGTKKKK